MSYIEELNEMWSNLSINKEVDKEKLWNMTLRYVYLIVKRRINELDIIDDVVQDTFLKIIKIKSEKRVGIKNWAHYLYTIAINCIKDYYKKKKSKQTISFAEDMIHGDAIAGIQDTHTREASEKEEVYKALITEKSQLIDKIILGEGKEKANVFSLYLEGCKYREIAKETEKGVNTVATIIYNIKKKYLYERP